MEKLPIREVTGEVFAYESELPDTVKKAFEVFFEKKTIKQSSSDVAFGTKIKIFRASVKTKKAKELGELILKNIKKEDKETLIKKLRLHLDETGRLYLRFDKQYAAEKGKMQLTFEEEGNIQIVLAIDAYPGNPENYRKVTEQLLE